MARTVPLAMRIPKDDKKALLELTKYFRRSQTSTVCVLIREAHSQMKQQAASQANTSQVNNRAAN